MTWVFLLFFILLLHGVQLALCQAWARSWSEAYTALDSPSEENFEAYGKSWDSPLPRIDYGAQGTTHKEAPALCLQAPSLLSAADLSLLDCG